MEQRCQLDVCPFTTLVRLHRSLSKRHVIWTGHGVIEVQFVRQLKWEMGLMRILAVHAYYQRPGGEDLSYEANCQLLARRGHEVIRFTLNNRSIKAMSAVDRARRIL